MRNALTMVLVLALSGFSVPAAAQPGVQAALDLYASAAYEDALVALDALGRTDLPEPARLTVARHRMLCLMALGRPAEAEAAAAALLQLAPEFVLTEADASPRVRAMFDQARRQELPRVARQLYADGRGAFDAGRLDEAHDRFARLGRVLADPDLTAGDTTLGDLRALGEGFLTLTGAALDGPSHGGSRGPAAPSRPAPSVEELLARHPADSATSEAPVHDSTALVTTASPLAALGAIVAPAASPAAPPEARPDSPAATDETAAPVAGDVEAPSRTDGAAEAAGTAAPPTEPPPFTPIDFFVYDWRDADVTPPEPIAQAVSGWWGSRGAPEPGTPLGAVDMLVDEQGRVTDARIYVSVSRVYDAVLLQSVKAWRYRPALRGGRPVKYRRVSDVVAGGR
ncbi:MAG: energy transducer TonB [Vicinamibacterales bacterium]